MLGGDNNVEASATTYGIPPAWLPAPHPYVSIPVATSSTYGSNLHATSSETQSTRDLRTFVPQDFQVSRPMSHPAAVNTSSQVEGMGTGPIIGASTYTTTKNHDAGDGSELVQFIPPDICSFLKFKLGISTVEDFASSDRFQVANHLFSWYQAMAENEGNLEGCRPLKFVEAQVYSWLVQMNKLRQRQGFPPLPTKNGPCYAGEQHTPATGNSYKSSKKKGRRNDRSSADDSRKKRKPPPTEMTSKKDILIAKTVLSNAVDLATILPVEECDFLGVKFWIFTVQQLECVLARSLGADKSNEEAAANPEVTRSHLVDKIMEEMGKVPAFSNLAMSAGGSESDGAAVGGEQQVLRRNAAEALVSTWEDKLNRRKSTNENIPTSEPWLRVAFPLVGPLSILFPPALIQFLQRVGIVTAYDFLSAKKTEHSLLVFLFQAWSEKHKFKVSKPVIVARFLMSVSARLHTAMASVPPASSFTRGWTGCNLQVLTGFAREFTIFHCRFTNDNDFLIATTKDLARLLANFREAKGMPVLKGTGNVATVSGWKTLVKETGDIGDSLKKLLPEVPFDMKASIAADRDEEDDSVVEVNEGKKRQRSNSATPGVTPTANAALTAGISIEVLTGTSTALSKPKPINSKRVEVEKARHISSKGRDGGDDSSSSTDELRSEEFFRHVLKPSQIKFLASAGILNAEQLLRADKGEESKVIQELIGWRRKRGFDEMEVSSIVKAMLEWTSKVKEELKALGYDKATFSKKQQDKKRKYDATETDAAGEAQKQKSEPDASPKRKRKPRRTVPKIFEEDPSLDPIEALSPMAKEFLNAEGITTAQEFLSKGTSDLAESYKLWRERQGLNALKGFGAVSIMSGWKGVVRDTCEKVGRSELVEVDNTVRSRNSKNNTGRESSKKRSKAGAPKGGDTSKVNNSEKAGRTSSSLSDSNATSFGMDLSADSEEHFGTHCSIMNGLPSRNFTVCGYGQDPTLYDFQLSVRKASGEKKVADYSVCLSYKGARRSTSRKAAQHTSTPTRIPLDSSSPTRHVILPEYSGDGNDFVGKNHVNFCSLGPSDGGLIDLSRFHLFPLSSSATRGEDIQVQLKRFVLSEIDSEPQSPKVHASEGAETCVANVSTSFDAVSGRSRQLLYLSEPIEKGQTMQLEMAATTPVAPMQSGYDPDLVARAVISDSLCSMSASEISRVLTFLEEKVLPDVMSRIEAFLLAEVKKQPTLNIATDTPESGSNGSDAKPSAIINISCEEASKLFTARRRLHFIAGKAKDQVSSLLREERLPDSDRAILGGIPSCADKLLWDHLIVDDTVSSIRQWKEGFVFTALCKEVSNELQFIISQQGALAARCRRCLLSHHLSSEIIMCHLSTYTLTAAGSSTGSNQQTLAKEIFNHAVAAAKELSLLSDAAVPKTKGDILRLVIHPKGNAEGRGHVSYVPDATRLPRYHVSALSRLTPFDVILKSSQQEQADSFPPDRRKVDDSFVVVQAESGDRSLRLAVFLDISSESDVEALLQILGSSSRLLKLSVDFRWYLLNQVLEIVDGIASSGIVNWLKPIHDLCVASYSYDALTKIVRESLGAAALGEGSDVSGKVPDAQQVADLVYLILPPDEPLAGATRDDFFPNTCPIFLRLIWPILESKFSWRIHAGRTAATVSFLPPESLDKKRKTGTIDNAVADRKQKKISRKLKSANIPMRLPRNLKQIFVRFAESAMKKGGESDVGEGEAGHLPAFLPLVKKKSAKDAIGDFVESVECKDEKDKATLKAVSQTMLAMFNNMIPLSFPEKQDTTLNGTSDATTSSAATDPCEHYGCEYLLWLVVVLPDLLAKSGVPVSEQESIEAFIEALLLHLSKHHSETFADEAGDITAGDDGITEVGISRRVLDVLEKAAKENAKETSNDAAQGEEDKEHSGMDLSVVRESDLPFLTEFAAYALAQVQICFAREEDVNTGKRQGFRVGAPGLICIHCLRGGDSPTSRSFFSNQSSIATSPSQIVIHCQKCKHCPQDVVANLIAKKQLHSQQKKSLRGSQATFYNNLFKRMSKMRRSRTGGTVIDVSSSVESSDEDIPTSSTEINENDVEDSGEVFYSHVEAIRFVMEDKFYQRREMISAINLYFQTLDLGGSLWKTDAFPADVANGTSEWLLRHVFKKINAQGGLEAPQQLAAATLPAHTAAGIGSAYCSVDGCTKYKQQNSNNMCRSHWNEMKRGGKKPGPVAATATAAGSRSTKKPRGSSTSSSRSTAMSASANTSTTASTAVLSNDHWSCHLCTTMNPPSRKRCTSCSGWREGNRKKWSRPLAVVEKETE